MRGERTVRAITGAVTKAHNLSRAALVVLGILVTMGIVDALFAKAPIPTKPGFVGTIFASHGVVSAIRIAIIFGAAYLVVSVIVLGRRGRWLTKFGPAETSEVARVFSENQELSTGLEEATAELQLLRGRLEASDDLVRSLASDKVIEQR